MFAELNITSNFTFLTGGSHPEEYMERAALLGLPPIPIPAMNAATIIAIEAIPTPVCRARMRCHATW